MSSLSHSKFFYLLADAYISLCSCLIELISSGCLFVTRQLLSSYLQLLPSTVHIMGSNTVRRSKRLQTQKSALHTKHPIQKLQSSENNRSVRSTTLPVDLDSIEAHLAQKKRTSKFKTTPGKGSKGVSSCASDSETSSSFSEDSGEDYNEFTDISSENFQWNSVNGYKSKRNISYDSRFESGNEDYDIDGFVVNDDEIEDSIAGLNESSDDDLHIDGYESSYGIICSGKEGRKSSNLSSTASTSSKLFFSDTRSPTNPPSVSWSEFGFYIPNSNDDAPETLIEEASAEVVEEIVDALAMFSRRCNRNKAPVKFELAAAVSEDEEIKDVLGRAVKLGLARRVSLRDGSIRWIIGPKSR